MAARMNELQLTPSAEDRLGLLKYRSTRWVGSGLLNLGKTSFINSVLQCLLHTPPILNYAHHCPAVHDFCVFCEVKKLAVTPHPASPKAFTSHLKSIGRELHRLHECDPFLFLSLLLQKMPDQSFVSSVFSIGVREEAECAVCGKVEVSRKELTALSVCGHSAQAAVTAWQHSALGGCTTCCTTEARTSRKRIYKAPLVLTLRIRQLPARKSPHTDTMEYGNLLEVKEAGEQPVGYELFAVLVHAGDSLEHGHFYAFVLTGSMTWYCMDDVKTVAVEASTVLAHPGAYMLFYKQQCRDPLDQLLGADGRGLVTALVGAPQDGERLCFRAAQEALGATFAKVARSY